LKKSFIIFAVVCLIAIGGIIVQRKLSAASPSNFTKEDVTKILGDMLPPQQLAQFKADPKAKEEFRKNLIRLLAISAEAEQRGLFQKPETRKQLEIVYLQVIADYWSKTDEGKKNPVKKEDVEAFYKEKPTAFDDFVAGQPNFKKAPNLEGLKQQYGEICVNKQRAEAAGVPNRRDFQLQLKLIQANAVANDVVQQIQSTINPTDPEVQAFYDSHKAEFDELKASHILISTMPKQPQPGPDGQAPKEMPKPLTKEEAKKKALEILAKVQGGGDFAKLAQENSDDPGSKTKGGDLGFFRSGQMVKPFEDAAKSLKPGEVTKDLVETQFGFHIIKLTERRVAPLDDAMKAEIRERIKRDKLDAKLDELAQRYKIQVAADFDIPEPKMPAGMPMGQ
jgi:hypothetical protein